MSLGGNYYGLVIVDDYSRFTWTLFSKTKNEAFDAFHKLAKVIENEMVLTLFHLEVIREVNFKMSLLKDFVKKMEFTTISLPQEHPNRMVLWRGKIDPLKKVQEPL